MVSLHMTHRLITAPDTGQPAAAAHNATQWHNFANRAKSSRSERQSYARFNKVESERAGFHRYTTSDWHTRRSPYRFCTTLDFSVP